MSNYKQKMYHLVIYQLSGIQAGIQAGHAKDAYSILYGNDEEYKQWLNHDKTVILLNGGTTNSGNDGSAVGTMQNHLQTLTDMKVKAEPFYEPDLNNAMTAIAFLVDERVWDKEKYPDYYSDFNKKTFLVTNYGEQIANLRLFLEQFTLARN